MEAMTGTSSKIVHGSSQYWNGQLVMFFHEPQIGGTFLCPPNEHDAYDYGDENGYPIGVLNCRKCSNEAIVNGDV